MKRILFVLLLLIVPGAGFGQSKVPVLVESTVGENDLVGQQMVFEIKEAIRGSQGFRLVEDVKQWPYMKYIIVTGKTVDGWTATGYSIIYESNKTPLNGAYISSGLRTCPRNEALSCARAALSGIDRALEFLLRYEPELWKTLK